MTDTELATDCQTDAAGSTIVASIVIPFGKAPEQLSAQLTSLSEQGRKHHNLELIVSCNRRELLTQCHEVVATTPLSFAVRVVDSSNSPGPAGARNEGWRCARGDLILFCDSDDIAEPGWVVEMIRSLDDADLAIGSLSVDGIGNRSDVASWWAPDALDEYPKFGHLPYGPAASLGVRRCLLVAIDGFDETARAAEDIDLCWRLQYAGARVVRLRNPRIRYRLRSTIRALCRQGIIWGYWDAWLLKKHRSNGASRSFRETLWEGRALLFLACKAIKNPSERSHALFWACTMTGRILGSIRFGTWAA